LPVLILILILLFILFLILLSLSLAACSDLGSEKMGDSTSLRPSAAGDAAAGSLPNPSAALHIDHGHAVGKLQCPL
jgi:hypothetical protein